MCEKLIATGIPLKRETHRLACVTMLKQRTYCNTYTDLHNWYYVATVRMSVLNIDED